MTKSKFVVPVGTVGALVSPEAGPNPTKLGAQALIELGYVRRYVTVKPIEAKSYIIDEDTAVFKVKGWWFACLRTAVQVVEEE